MGTESQENNAQEQTPARLILVICDQCGARFKSKQWREGVKCPKCKEGALSPGVAPGGAVDYVLANRSEGYAIADIRVGQWAKWAELITPHQYEVAFVKQRRQVSAGGEIEPIHEILENQGFLTEGAATAILEFTTLTRPDGDDADLARRVIEKNIAPADKVKAIQDAQAKMAETANEIPPLVQLLCEKRVIDEGQLRALLGMQKQAGVGPLVTIPELIDRNRKESIYEKVAKGVKPPKHQIKNVLLVVGVFLLAGAAWYHQWRRQQVHVDVIFMDTRQQARILWPHAWPAKNLRTGKRTGYMLVKCHRCGHEFGRENPDARTKCPICGCPTAFPLYKLPEYERKFGKIGTSSKTAPKAAPPAKDAK